MKTTAVAPANIAFIKYWGKKDDKRRLPLNASISINLSGATTTTTVEFLKEYVNDVVDGDLNGSEKEKVVAQLDRLRAVAKSSLKAHVLTKNSFPKGAGVASSASGFAALTLAGATALGLKLSERELTILARIGSGSACRSIPDGFVYWKNGESSVDSYAYSLYPSSYWDLRDIVAIVDGETKRVSTSDAMARVKTSPFWQARVLGIPAKIAAVQYALKKKNIRDLGIVIEEDCINMHAVAMTQNPPVFYWNESTMAIIRAVHAWRNEGLPVYFTIDAGPNVHLMCEGRVEKDVLAKLRKVDGVQSVIENRVSGGAKII